MAFPAALTNLTTLAQATLVTPALYNDARTAINNIESALGVNLQGIPNYTSTWTPTFSNTIITASAVGSVPLTVNGYSASQTANLLNIYKNSGGQLALSVSANGLFTADLITATTNAVVNSVVFAATCSGTAANGFGQSVIHSIEAGDGSKYTAASKEVYWSNATAGSRTALIDYKTVVSASTVSYMQVESTGTKFYTLSNTGALIIQRTLDTYPAKMTLLSQGAGLLWTVGCEASSTDFIVKYSTTYTPITITAAGAFSVTGISGGSATALLINSGADSNIGLAVKANSGSQSANLQEWQNSSGTAMTLVNATGAIGIGTAPSAKLHVSATTGDPLLILQEGGTYGAYMRWDSTGGAGGRKYDIISTSASAGEGQGHFLINDNTSGATRMGVMSDGSVCLASATGLQWNANVYAVAEGSWRTRVNGNDLVMERYESSSWVEKGRTYA